MIRKILQKDDPVLHKVCHPVTKFDGKLAGLLEDLTATLEHANGQGPQIVEQEGEQEGFEGCLSLSGMYGIVKRPMKVKVQAQDRHGNPVEYEREGITARCFCHEIEHLDGHLFVEHTDRLMEGEELQQWLADHADQYEIEDVEVEEEQ